MRMRTTATILLAGSLAAASGGAVLAATAASAKTGTPTVWIVHEHGINTTPCFIHVGQVLLGIGDAPNEVVTSLTPAGPVDKVGLSVPLPNGVFDFKAPLH